MAVPMARVERRPPARVGTGDGGLDSALGGGWPLGRCVLVWGEPGAGKSRLVARWASRITPWALVALEVEGSEAVALAEHAGAHTAGGWLVDSAAGWESACAAVRARAVVLDSAHATGDPLGAVRRAVAYSRAHDALVFVVAHRNRSGTVRGDTGLEHWPDAVVQVRGREGSRALVRVRKSRFCARASAEVSLLGGD